VIWHVNPLVETEETEAHAALPAPLPVKETGKSEKRPALAGQLDPEQVTASVVTVA
jgi:hypothetical protein